MTASRYGIHLKLEGLRKSFHAQEVLRGIDLEILPGAMSSILVGVRFSLGIMWLTLIVAETIAADSGIGYMAMNAREFMQTDVVVLSILLCALFGKLADAISRTLERSWLRWNPNYQNV